MKMVKLIFSTAIALFAINSLSAQTAGEVTTKFNEAAEKYNAKQYAAAATLFVETIALGEKSEEDVAETLETSKGLLFNSYFNGGLNDAKAGKYDEALGQFEKAEAYAESVSSATNKAKASAMVANIYQAKGTAFATENKKAEAAEMFNKAYIGNDKNTKNGLLAAQYYAETGNPTRATEIYKAIITLGETHSKYAEAAKEAKDAFASNYLVAAVKATTENNYAEVVKNLDAVAEIDPSNAQALLLRVQAASKMKQYADVIKNAVAAAEAQPTPEGKSNVYFILGAAYQAGENKAKAIESYQKVTAGDNLTSAKAMITALSK